MTTLFKSSLRALSVAAVVAVSAGAAQATDLTMFKTVFGTDFTSAGFGGMRGNGTGTIALNTVAAGSTITEAYLFWHGPSNASTTSAATANANVTFGGTNVTGSFLGISSDNCWGFQNSLAYRADVTSLITGNGNYSLANFTKPGGIDVNGVSLVVFYNDGNSANNRDIVMFNGNDSNIDNAFDASGWNITLAGINYGSGSASAQFHVSDGQSFGDDVVRGNGTDISGADPFQGNSVPNGASAANTNGGLWDIKNFNVTSLLNPGLNNLNITTGVNGDCLSCIMIAIDLPAGAAPSQVSEPGTLALGALAFLGLAASRRSRAKVSAQA